VLLLNRVITMRDVTFDTLVRYKDDPKKDEITLTKQEADRLIVP